MLNLAEMTIVQYSAKRVFITLLFHQQQARLSHFLGDTLNLNSHILGHCFWAETPSIFKHKKPFSEKMKGYVLYTTQSFFFRQFITQARWLMA